jgi:hypothetical protein
MRLESQRYLAKINILCYREYMDLSALPLFPPVAQFFLLAWSIAWKGLALWKASKNDQRNWFIAVLVINTLGILEIIYLFRFAKKKMVLNDLMFWKASA